MPDDIAWSAPPAPVERPTTLYLNDQELVTLQTTPAALDDWAVGFLYGEGLISSPREIRHLAVDEEKGMVWVDLPEAGDLAGRQRYLTAGCGKGVTFSSLKDAMQLKPISHDTRAPAEQLLAWMRQLQAHTPLYAATGGVHAAGLADTVTGELIAREDIGRHNALDKVIGAALRAGWPLERAVALGTGRISYEAASKLARARIGIGVTLTAATDQAIRLAAHLGIDLLGYARSPKHMVIYTPGRRIS
jgi:FdhD protein